MNRRSFLRRTILGVGATVSLATVGFHEFLVGHGLRNKQPFPVWTAKWKRFGKPGWHAVTKMNVFDGQLPPIERCRGGVPYDRFRYDAANLTVSYVAR